MKLQNMIDFFKAEQDPCVPLLSGVVAFFFRVRVWVEVKPGNGFIAAVFYTIEVHVLVP